MEWAKWEDVPLVGGELLVDACLSYCCWMLTLLLLSLARIGEENTSCFNFPSVFKSSIPIVQNKKLI